MKNLSDCLEEINLSWQLKGNLAGLIKDWQTIAGEQLANNSHPLNLHREILTIGASHPQWRQALQYNRPQLLAALNASGHKIKEIRIKQYHQQPIHKTQDSNLLWELHPSRIDIHGLSNCPSCKCPAPKGEISLWNKCSFCRRKDLKISN